MNRGTLGGIFIALAGIAAGLYLDGGKLGQLLQPTAALIVLAARWARLWCSFRCQS